ncbi:MAG: Ger(x)C family spore germination protein [Oscillospiraceae bacterium]|jgi:spore germination protein KC|nr:Ger(x)C family spore germination protein [Oscillospiraceae bacterium]
MKRTALCLLLVAQLALCSSCIDTHNVLPEMSEIGNFAVIQVLGIDKKGDEIEVTLVAARNGAGGGEGSDGKRVTEIMSFSGATAVDAISRINSFSDKRQHLGYVDFLLIGEDAARDSITKYLDFFTRDHESRYSTNVFIVRGDTAKSFLRETASEERGIDEGLENVSKSVDALSDSRMLTLIDLVSMLETPYCATVVPALSSVDTGYGEMVGGEMPEKTFKPDGFAIIKDFRLADYFDAEIACAYNGLTERIHTAPICVTDARGHYVSLEMLHNKLKFDTVWEGDTLKGVKYDSLIYANLTEQLNIDDIYGRDALSRIETAAAEKLRAEMDAVVKKSKQVGQDCLCIADLVRMKNPVKWVKLDMENRWGELFPRLDIDVAVTCRITRTYDLREPTGLYRKDFQEKKQGAEVRGDA